MFNWVCPQCGKDVPPSKTECPFCEARAKEMAAAGYPQQPQHAEPPYGWQQQPQQPQHQPPPPQPQQSWQSPAPVGWQPQPPPPPRAWQPPVVAPPPPPPPPRQDPPPQTQQHNAPPPGWAPPQQPQYAQPPAAWPPPPRKSGPPTWAMGLGFALAFIGIGAAVIFGVQHFGRTNTAEKAGLENPANPSQQKVSNPVQKYVEVTGIRMMAENKKPVAKFMVVNHSSGEISGLQANITLWASTSRSEEDSIGSFSFKVNSLGPNGSEEVTAPLKTKLKMYELPDWQNLQPEIQITSPAPQ